MYPFARTSDGLDRVGLGRILSVRRPAPPRWLADLGLLSRDASVTMLSMNRSGRAATLELLEPADIKGGDISAELLLRPAPYGSFGESRITVRPRVREGHSRSEEVIYVAGHDAEVV
jgi:hypothetical protein